MSADNWAVCPRCVALRESELAEREAAVFDSYGNVPIEDFDRAREELATARSRAVEPTFREDYEIYGAEDGVVEVCYSGACATCGLRLKFSHEHPLDVSGGAA